MPLTAAFLHIQQVVGGEELAEEDLRLRLASGDVAAQNRLVTPGEGIDIIPLAPEDFKGSHPLLFGIYEVGHNKFLCGYDLLRHRGHNIFLRHADVHRVWPMRLAELASPSDQQLSKQLPTKRPRGIGPRVWLVAREVDALMREGGKGSKWIDLDALLDTIRSRIGDNGLSKRTLSTALAYLRNNGLIDR